MNSYHIGKNGKQTGPFDEETIRQQIATGVLNTSDLCWREGMKDWQAIGTVLGYTQQAGTPPPPLARLIETTPSSPHQLTTFPVALAILLHYATFGIFTLVWLNLMHGKMCRVRPDDPSAGKALGFCFIPFFNYYWIFFTYRRLCLRIDEQRDLYGLPPGNL
ncbi:MAG: GYF domain-containing protein, partial [Pseudomonadota bacterium]